MNSLTCDLWEYGPFFIGAIGKRLQKKPSKKNTMKIVVVELVVGVGVVIVIVVVAAAFFHVTS